MDQENRRSFVKKSLATSVSISFAGLIRAHGEEGGGSTTTWNPDATTHFATTHYGTTHFITTWNPDATTIITTGATTLPYDPFVLVCTEAPATFLQRLTSHNKATETGGNGIIEPYQLIGFDLVFEGPQVGDYSFTTFDLTFSGAGTATELIEMTVEQTVGFDANNNIVFTPEPANPGIDGFLCDGRNFDGFIEVSEGRMINANLIWEAGASTVDFGNGHVPASISLCACMPEEYYGWSFTVMRLSDAIEFQNSLKQ